LRDFYLTADGAEGFVGEGYFRAYPAHELPRLNELFGVREFEPALTLFGSSGGGEAFAFSMDSGSAQYLQIPFIPFTLKYARDLGSTLEQLFVNIAGGSSPNTGREPNPEVVGKEIHEVKPVIFGGDPVDADNKLIVPTLEYAPLVVWWNRLYYDTISKQ
jgi:hypothetical protein